MSHRIILFAAVASLLIMSAPPRAIAAGNAPLSASDLIGRWLLSEVQVGTDRRPTAGVFSGYMELKEDGSFSARIDPAYKVTPGQKTTNYFSGTWTLESGVLTLVTKQNSSTTRSKVSRDGPLLVLAPEAEGPATMTCYYSKEL